MSRRRCSVWWSVVGLVLGCLSASVRADVPASPTLMPAKTKGFASLADYQFLVEQWGQTQLGHLMSDAVMEPFAADLRRAFQERWTQMRDRLGLRLEDLADVLAGEVALGVILPKKDAWALIMLADVTDHIDKTKVLLDKVSQNLVQQGAKRQVLNVPETDAEVVFFDIPAPKDNPKLGPHKAYYCLTGNLLVATSDQAELQGVLARLAGRGSASLAGVDAFQQVTARLKQDAAEGPRQFRWFVEPVGFSEALRAAIPPERRPRRQSVLDLIRKQGGEALRGVGGFVDLAAEGYQLVHRSAVYAPQPLSKSMVMLKFPEGQDFKPQSWVPRDVAAYLTFYFDILNAFDHIGPLFDEIFGQGEAGVWDQTLDSLKLDENGPKIDLRPELIQHLGPRISVVTDYELPITPDSERQLFAIEAKDPRAVADAIRKVMEIDPTAQRRQIEGHVIWEIVDEEIEGPTPPTVEPGGLPSLVPQIDEDEEDEPEERLLPHAAITVAQGHLFVASHLDFLLKILKPKESREMLARSIDYRVVDATLGKLGVENQFGRLFMRTDETIRATYGLTRQGKLDQSTSLAATLLRMVFGSNDGQGVVERQQIPGENLPAFDVARRYLGPGGAVAGNDAHGWFLKGSLLEKQ